MNQEYDVIVCGTGFTECILSGLLSTHKKKVLHIDRNSYYGGESASLNLTNLFQKFKPPQAQPKSSAQQAKQTTSEDSCAEFRCVGKYKSLPSNGEWGMNREWNVDIISKFIMANGKLVKILLKTGVKEYLEFQIIEGSYVYQHQKGGWWSSADKYIHKVPATESEALTSNLIGLTEKLKAKSFFAFIASYNDDDYKTWIPRASPGHLAKAEAAYYNPYTQISMEDCYKYFGVSKSIIEFVGHSIALHTNDDYLKQPMAHTMNKLKLYLHSLLRYGSSPFIYPMYGLGTLPEGFSRLSAVYGGIYMLNTPVKYFLFDEKEKKIVGIQTFDDQIALAKIVICDPTYCLGVQVAHDEDGDTQPDQQPPYFSSAVEIPQPPLEIPPNTIKVTDMPHKVKKTGKVIRVINILNAPIPGTGQKSSCQIILPQAQLNRHTDIYVAAVSSAHGICKEGKYVALVSATVETDDPMRELQPAFELLGDIEQQFVAITDVFEAADDGKNDNVYVSDSYDAQSHFESASENVLNMWRNIYGENLDLTSPSVRGSGAAATAGADD